MKRLQKLLAARADTIAAMEAMLNAADQVSAGILSADDQTKYDALVATLASTDASIAREKQLIEAVRVAPSIATTAALPAAVTLDAGDRPFRSLGEQLQAIAGHYVGEQTDPRLYGAAASGGATAGTGGEGGFAIQKDFASELLESTITGGDLLGKADTHEVGPTSDGLKVLYLNETSRATGSRWGGIQVYRGAEAAAATAKRPDFGVWSCDLEDIIGLAYVTDRLLSDAPSLQNVFNTGFSEEFRFTAENEMVRGSGVGQMLGIVGAPGTVSVAKETGQTAATIVAENIMNMWARVHPRSRNRGAWFYNAECDPQLQQMQIGTGTSAQLVYMPPGGLTGAKFGTIYGQPCIPIEYASALGTVGDIFYADWSRFKVITKGGLKSDESIHVRFTTNERTFRWITRINGAPKDKSALTPFKGSATLSAFVTLATRA